jgi:hypothetical protein
MGEKWEKYAPLKFGWSKRRNKKPLNTHGSPWKSTLPKTNNPMQSNGLCLLSSIGQMKKTMTNVLKIYCTFLTIWLKYGLV